MAWANYDTFGHKSFDGYCMGRMTKAHFDNVVARLRKELSAYSASIDSLGEAPYVKIRQDSFFKAYQKKFYELGYGIGISGSSIEGAKIVYLEVSLVNQTRRAGGVLKSYKVRLRTCVTTDTLVHTFMKANKPVFEKALNAALEWARKQ